MTLCAYMNDWIKMLDVRIQRKSPPHNNQLGFIRFLREPQPLFFVNIPSIILRPDKYNTSINLVFNLVFNFLPDIEIHVQTLRHKKISSQSQWLGTCFKVKWKFLDLKMINTKYRFLLISLSQAHPCNSSNL